MLLKTKVKVGNITNLSDARYCAGMGVDMLGFPIGMGVGRISIETFQEIAAWVAGPEFILELPDKIDRDLVEKVTLMESIKHIQLNMDQFESLRSTPVNSSFIINTNLDEWKQKRHELIKVDSIAYLILDDNKPDWNQIKEINSTQPVLIPYAHLPPDSDAAEFPIAGILLEGTSEDKPGQKDYDQLATVLESLSMD